MALRYRRSERRNWQWFYAQSGNGPAIALPANRWRCLMDHCELLYISRWNLIAPFVETRVEAFEINAALIWNGFVLRGSSPHGRRHELVPVFWRARNPDRAFADDSELRLFMNEIWAENFLCWLPTSPARKPDPL